MKITYIRNCFLHWWTAFQWWRSFVAIIGVEFGLVIVGISFLGHGMMQKIPLLNLGSVTMMPLHQETFPFPRVYWYKMVLVSILSVVCICIYVLVLDEAEKIVRTNLSMYVSLVTTNLKIVFLLSAFFCF
jgi:hypothetical protein